MEWRNIWLVKWYSNPTKASLQKVHNCLKQTVREEKILQNDFLNLNEASQDDQKKMTESDL